MMIVRASYILAACIVIISSTAHACSVFSKTVEAASNFDLIVQSHGTPVSGLTITVTPIGSERHTPLLQLKSDHEGRVAIHGLQPGTYEIENLGPIQTGALIAIVKSNGPATLSKPLVFNWPWYGIVKARQLRGTLHSADPQAPLEEVDLSLSTLDSGSILKTFHSGPSGFFDFGDLAPGLYLIQVRAKQPAALEGWRVEGSIAVELAPGSATAHDQLQLGLGETSCGIWYAQCDQQNPISLASRRIRLADPNGAAVASAQYSVSDRAGKKIAAGRSNSDGRIQLPGELRGSYELTIYSAGFTPLEQRLEFVEPDSRAVNLEIIMNVGGVCSQAKLETHATPQ